jgi:hypothetical protein
MLLRLLTHGRAGFGTDLFDGWQEIGSAARIF